MALASLCSYIRLKQAKKKFKDSNSAWTTDFHFTSFIVDHKARDGSSDEAELVASRLHARSMSLYIAITLSMLILLRAESNHSKSALASWHGSETDSRL